MAEDLQKHRYKSCLLSLSLAHCRTVPSLILSLIPEERTVLGIAFHPNIKSVSSTFSCCC